jgi:hypothetical protein
MQFDQWLRLTWKDLEDMAEAIHRDIGAPMPFWEGSLLIICHDLREFVNPTVFGVNATLYGLGEQRFGPMFAVGLLLAPSPNDLRDDPRAFGRWAGRRITIAPFGSEIVFAEKQNLAQYARDNYTDISYHMVGWLAANNEFESRPWPRSFRAILRDARPITKDLTWLPPHALTSVLVEARSHGFNFYRRFVRWLRRQNLTENTRRELGGRPGRIEHFRQLREEREGKRRRPRGVRIRKRT